MLCRNHISRYSRLERTEQNVSCSLVPTLPLQLYNQPASRSPPATVNFSNHAFPPLVSDAFATIQTAMVLKMELMLQSFPSWCCFHDVLHHIRCCWCHGFRVWEELGRSRDLSLPVAVCPRWHYHDHYRFLGLLHFGASHVRKVDTHQWRNTICLLFKC